MIFRSLCVVDQRALAKMSDNQYQFLRAQVKAFHPNWTEEQIEAECKNIIEGKSEDADDGCLYCGS